MPKEHESPKEERHYSIFGGSFSVPRPVQHPDHYLVALVNQPRFRSWSKLKRYFAIEPADFELRRRIADLVVAYLENHLPFRTIDGSDSKQSIYRCQASPAVLRVSKSSLPAGYSRSLTYLETEVSAGFLHLHDPICHLSLRSHSLQLDRSDLKGTSADPVPRYSDFRSPSRHGLDCEELIQLTLLGRALDRTGIDGVADTILRMLPFLELNNRASGLGQYATPSDRGMPYLAQRRPTK